MFIKEVHAKEILDSRKIPTIEVSIITDAGKSTASVPSGTSTGKYEAIELRNKQGSVQPAIKNIQNIITPRIINKNFKDQQEIDNLLIKLDGTNNKKRVGANAILAISMAVCRAFAQENKTQLYNYLKQISKTKNKLKMPRPLMLIFEGGKHAEANSDIQEYMIIPHEKTFKENVKTGKKIYKQIGTVLKKNNFNKMTGMEGAYYSLGNELSIELVSKVIKKVNPKTKIAIDVAASEFFKDNHYILERKKVSSTELSEWYEQLLKNFPIASIEDPFDQDDENTWKLFNKKQGGETMIVGDDFLTTNPSRIKKAIKEKACNAMILKINQIGTITEAISAAQLAQKAGWKVIVSHRSGETQDSFIADLAVGIGADFVKIGAPSQKERMTKYDRLMKIEKEI
ncbi:MAG: hypothetical protein RL557_202 [archaeon]|jgi:enolase